MNHDRESPAAMPAVEDHGRRTESFASSLPNNGRVIKRKEPIAAWRLVVLFGWYVVKRANLDYG